MEGQVLRAGGRLPSVELHEAIRRRAMVRSFSAAPVDPDVVDRILQAALRAPTAGNTRGTAWVVLEGPEQTAVYFDATTDEMWRTHYKGWSEGLARAPVVLLAYTSPDAYVARYAEEDKARAGLGDGEAEWPVPYWIGDAAFGVMTVLLAVVDAGLGSCILGTFRGEAELAAQLDVPAGWRLFAAVVLGHPDGRDHRSASLDRAGPGPADRIHRASW
jgi:nitroreductase